MAKKPEKTDEFIVYCSYTEIMEIGSLTPHPNNPNVHPPEQIELLANILRNNGWRNPIVVSKRSGFITKGHARLEAAQKNGWTKVPVDVQDYESEAKEYADILADNKIAELAHRDPDKEKFIFQEKILNSDIDVSLTGYQQTEIDSILNGWQSDASSMDKIEEDPDQAPGRVTIRCKSEDEDELREFVEMKLKEASFTGIKVE